MHIQFLLLFLDIFPGTGYIEADQSVIIDLNLYNMRGIPRPAGAGPGMTREFIKVSEEKATIRTGLTEPS